MLKKMLLEKMILSNGDIVPVAAICEDGVITARRTPSDYPGALKNGNFSALIQCTEFAYDEILDLPSLYSDVEQNIQRKVVEDYYDAKVLVVLADKILCFKNGAKFKAINFGTEHKFFDWSYRHILYAGTVGDLK